MKEIEWNNCKCCTSKEDISYSILLLPNALALNGTDEEGTVGVFLENPKRKNIQNKII